MIGDQLDSEVEILGQIYCGIMNVVADRLAAIAESIAEVEANPDHPNNWRNAEFCYLQIRKCVEYVALALLAAHRENGYECEAIENAYKADVIFNDLGKLNPHGFPTAVQIDLNDPGTGQHQIAPYPALSKRRMKRIYDDCAVHLHSGKLADIMNQTVPPYDLPKVVAWRDSLASLLNQHTVMLPHIGMVMIVSLRDPDLGASRVIFGKAGGPLLIGDDPVVYNAGHCP